MAGEAVAGHAQSFLAALVTHEAQWILGDVWGKGYGVELERHQWRALVEGIAAFSNSLAEMGDGGPEAETKLIGYLANLPLDKPDVVRALVQAALLLEGTEDLPDGSGEAGTPTPRLKAREWLQDLSRSLRAGPDRTAGE